MWIDDMVLRALRAPKVKGGKASGPVEGPGP